MVDATHLFYSTDKGAWVPAFSIRSDEEAARMNKIIGREFYVRMREVVAR